MSKGCSEEKINEIAQAYEGFKFLGFNKAHTVFDFLRVANINPDDPLEKFEAIGFYCGYLKGQEKSA